MGRRETCPYSLIHQINIDGTLVVGLMKLNSLACFSPDIRLSLTCVSGGLQNVIERK